MSRFIRLGPQGTHSHGFLLGSRGTGATTGLAPKVREVAPASAWDSTPFALFLGKNRSPAPGASFPMRRGLSPMAHRYMGIQPDSEPSPFPCDGTDKS